MVRLSSTPLGNRIRSLRADRGWSQKQLARAAGVPRPWLSLVETGETPNPSAARLTKVADALGVDPHYLLAGEHRRPILETEPEKLPWLIRVASLPLETIKALVELTEHITAPVADTMLSDVRNQQRSEQHAKANGDGQRS